MEEESPVIRAVRQKVREWIDNGNIFKTLDLSNMNITELSADIFTGCYFLRYINLAGNKLTKLSADLFMECCKLNKSYLGDNQLIRVDLGYNQLTELPTGLFANCYSLGAVYLNNNKLTELPADLFAECSRLRYITFDEPIIYGILWSLCDLDKIRGPFDSGINVIEKFPKECALVKKFRRVANDPLSYAWSVRRHVLIGMEI